MTGLYSAHNRAWVARENFTSPIRSGFQPVELDFERKAMPQKVISMTLSRTNLQKLKLLLTARRLFELGKYPIDQQLRVGING
jgi:hypothetical protein